jgi:hypothetical protein
MPNKEPLKGGNRWKYIKRMVGFKTKTPTNKNKMVKSPVTKKRWGNYFKFNWRRNRTVSSNRSKPVTQKYWKNKNIKPNSLITEENFKNENQEIVFVPKRSRALTRSRKPSRRSTSYPIQSSRIVHV